MQTLFSYGVALWTTLIVPCVTNTDNWKYCFTDWDVWLYPEIQRGIDLYLNPSSIYKEEQEKLKNINIKK